MVAIAANYGDTLALKSDGTVWAWGDNTYGQLGINSFNSSLTPVEVLGPGGAGNLSGSSGLPPDGSTAWRSGPMAPSGVGAITRVIS